MRWILTTALIAASSFSGQAQSQECAVTVEANDLLQFIQKEITVSSSCESFSVTLKHIGTMAANVMGHNWVLTKTSDYQGAAMDGMATSLASNYVKPDDARVLAATPVIGGGEETTISFDPSTLEVGGDYTYFCSFPGHFAAMNGKLIVE